MPNHYLKETRANYAKKSDTEEFLATIPIVDMNNFERNKSVFVDGIEHAFRTVGFVGIINTSVHQSMLTQMYCAAKDFFEQDNVVKSQITSLTNSGERGYVGSSESPVGKDITLKDQKEFVHFGRELTSDKQISLGYPQNIWPEQVDLRTPGMQLYHHFSDLVHPISESIERAIGASPSYLKKMTAEGDHLFRLVRYPKTLEPKQEGAAPHTDSNLYTILPPATGKGLEVLVDQQWVPVIVPPSAVIVNVGSMLEHMTNGYFHAAVHRVVKYEEQKGDRYSVAFFVHTRENDLMTPHPSSIEKTGGTQKYPHATRQELLDQRLVAMDRATPEKIQKYADSGLLNRWKGYIQPEDVRKGILLELEKVESVLNNNNLNIE